MQIVLLTRNLKIYAIILALLFPPFEPISIFPGPGHDHDHGTAAAEEEKQLYTCSMHPFIIQEGPGKCPICGMDLVPLRSVPGRKEEELQPNIISIDPVTQQNMGVRTAPVVRRDLVRAIRTVGLVGYDEPHQYSVNTKVDGWIERLHVNETGESVRKGQPLLEIYSPELVSAQEEYLLARRNRELFASSPFPEIAAGSGNLLAAAEKRLSYWDISKEQIEVLTMSGKVSKTMTLYAPYDGTVIMKKVNEGSYVRAGSELFQVSDISRVWIYADIYEFELPWIEEGQPATVYFPYPRDPVQGRVSTVYPYVEPRTRTIKARIDLDNPDQALKPDMYVTVVIAGRGETGVLAIPAEAVLHSGRQRTVFVALGDGRFDPRPVQTGLESEDGYVHVIEGLHEGEVVVTSAQFMLDSESRLREAVRKLVPVPPPPAQPDQPGKQEELEDLFK